MVRGEGLTFRPMTGADTDAAAAVEATVADSWSAEGIRAALACPAARCFVAERNGEFAGFAAFTLVCDEANLDALSVAAAHRRCGVARGLLCCAFAALLREGAAHLYLEVRSQNAPARALYAALGFAAIGLRRNFYANPADDAILMEKHLC